jgi:hypothetical protein
MHRVDTELYPVTNGYINNVGEFVLELPQNTYIPRRFSEGLAALRFVSPSSEFDTRIAYINKTGEFVIPPEFVDIEGLEGAENFSEGLAAATLPETQDERGFALYGYINQAGEMVIFPEFAGAHSFSDGIAVVEIFSEDSVRFAFINKQGEIIFEHPQAYEAYDASEGLAAISIDELWGFIDTTGNLVIEPQFPNVDRFFHGLAPATQLGARRPGQYRDQYGYIDHTGQFVIPPQFDDAKPFAEGLAAVKIGEDENGRGGQWGYIDTTGQFVIPPQFQDTIGAVSDFSEGLAAVTIPDSRYGYNGKAGYIDRTGHFVISPQFNYMADSFVKGLAYVWVLFERKIRGREIPKPPSKLSRTSYLDLFSSGPSPYRGGKFGYINEQGHFVWEEKYDE